jgi:hypothetical protein
MVTMYPVIDAPFPVAPRKSIIALLFAGVPSTVVGAVGVPAGVATNPEELDPVPTPLVAAAVKVYATPFVSPVTSTVVDPEVVEIAPG